MVNEAKLYIVEHLDPELGPWSALEYQSIAKESTEAGALFCLSSVSRSLTVPERLSLVPGFSMNHQSVEDLYAGKKDRICLLDPSANLELSPDDGSRFDVFLFGGILGMLLFHVRMTIFGLTQETTRRRSSSRYKFTESY